MQEIMAWNVISQLASAVMELNTIVNIRKYKKLHGGHNFILMAMEVHSTPKQVMDRFIKECASLFHYKQSWAYLSFFCIHVFR